MTRPPSVDTSSGQQRSDAETLSRIRVLANINEAYDRSREEMVESLRWAADEIEALAARVEALEAALRSVVTIATADGWGQRPGDHPMREAALHHARAALTPGAPS